MEPVEKYRHWVGRNPLRLARQRAGVPVDAIVALLKKSPAAYRSYERGLSRPRSEVLAQLGALLDTALPAAFAQWWAEHPSVPKAEQPPAEEDGRFGKRAQH